MTVRAGLAATALGTALWLVAAPAGAQPAEGSGVIRTEPGSAPVESVAPARPATGSPLLTYAALGLAGLAAVLGGATLALVLQARGRLDALADDMGMRPAPDPRLPERLSRLEAQVRALAAPTPRRAAADPAYAAPPPSASRTGTFPPSAPAPAPAPAPIARPDLPSLPLAAPASADRLHAWMDELTARFARLALDPSSAAAGFIAEHAPRGALAGPEGVALLDGFEGAKLWAARAPVEGEVWALTPGEQAVLNWSAHFASQRTQVAAEVFGEAFDLVDGGAGLRLEAPALVRRDASGRLSVRRRGRLSGFRS